MESVTTGIWKPARATMSGGKKVQNPKRNNNADTKTDGTNAFVFADAISPSESTISTI